MNLKRLFSEIIRPLVVVILFSFLLSIIECCNCFSFIKTETNEGVLSSIIQIESLLFAGIITVLTLRVNIIDGNIQKNQERFNEILVKYGYYGYTLFDDKFEENYQKLKLRINKKINESKENHLLDDYKSASKDEKNVDFCFEIAHKELKQYRKAHFEAVKFLLINFLLIICLALVATHIDFSNLSCIFNKTLKTTIVGMALYSVYETYWAIKVLFGHPFNVR